MEQKPLHIRIPVGMHAEITDFAQRTHRSVNGAANYLLKAALERELTADAPAAAFAPTHTR